VRLGEGLRLENDPSGPGRVGHRRKEIDPPRRRVIRWQNEWEPAFKTEGPSRCTIELEPEDHAVKLTLTHEIDRPDSPFIMAVADGWPRILSNLKSLLETGQIGW
jgi:uncharacterized protein YndB with AHSA1/START domain